MVVRLHDRGLALIAEQLVDARQLRRDPEKERNAVQPDHSSHRENLFSCPRLQRERADPQSGTLTVVERIGFGLESDQVVPFPFAVGPGDRKARFVQFGSHVHNAPRQRHPGDNPTDQCQKRIGSGTCRRRECPQRTTDGTEGGEPTERIGNDLADDLKCSRDAKKGSGQADNDQKVLFG